MELIGNTRADCAMLEEPPGSSGAGPRSEGMHDDTPTAEEQRWLAVWNDKRRAVAEGRLSRADVCDWVWKNKVLNAIGVTIQRIKRSDRPGRDPRRTVNTWVTVAAERGAAKEDASALAVEALNHVVRRLEERGHEFDVDWMVSSRDVIVISVNVKELRAFMNRRRQPPSPADSNPA
jgi:hypothetical protein